MIVRLNYSLSTYYVLNSEFLDKYHYLPPTPPYNAALQRRYYYTIGKQGCFGYIYSSHFFNVSYQLIMIFLTVLSLTLGGPFLSSKYVLQNRPNWYGDKEG